MSDALKIAGITAGVGLAIYGLIRLCTRKCKKCGQEKFKVIAENKVRKYLKSVPKSYYQIKTIQKQTFTFSHNYREIVLVEEILMEYECLACKEVQKEIKTVKKEDFQVDVEELGKGGVIVGGR